MSVKKKLALPFVALLLSSCVSPTGGVADLENLRPKFTVNCTLSQAACDEIEAGIVHLENNLDTDCQFSGNMARLIFDHPDYGFAPGDANIEADM